MRRTFLKRVNEMIANEPDTVFMTVDIGMWAIRDALRDYPMRCMNFGICEDAMFSIAAGMASRGMFPTIFGIQPYLIERTLEQIKMDLAYQKHGINVVGTGAAVDYSKYGYSHYCAEDVGVIKQIPGVEFVSPGTAQEFEKLFNETYRNGNTTFFRISDHPNVKNDCEVEFGKAFCVQHGKQATVIAVSNMLDDVMEVCEKMDVSILYYTTLSPFDGEAIKKEGNNRILVCEPHFLGSLDCDIIQAFEGTEVILRHVGLPREIYRNYGTYQDKMDYYELNSNKIKRELDLLING